MTNGHIGGTLPQPKQKGQPDSARLAQRTTRRNREIRMTMMARPRGLRLPDTSHLAPEDAELFAALYWERNYVSRGELQRVLVDKQRAAEAT